MTTVRKQQRLLLKYFYFYFYSYFYNYFKPRQGKGMNAFPDPGII